MNSDLQLETVAIFFQANLSQGIRITLAYVIVDFIYMD